jgi:hypothetical protein
MPTSRSGTDVPKEKNKKSKTKLKEVLENIVLWQVSCLVVLFVMTLPGVLQVLIGLTFFGAVFIYWFYDRTGRPAVLEASDISLLKKPFNGLVNISALLVFLVASHALVLTYAAEPRFWVQNKLVDIDSEANAILQEVLGDHYVLVPTSVYSPEMPYYFTYFDAIYNWNRLSRATGFYACANDSESCVPGVWVDAPYSDSWFDDVLTMLTHDALSSPYCIDGVEGLVIEPESESMSQVASNPYIMLFNTPRGEYTIVGITQQQRQKWLGGCEKSGDDVEMT